MLSWNAGGDDPLHLCHCFIKRQCIDIGVKNRKAPWRPLLFTSFQKICLTSLRRQHHANGLNNQLKVAPNRTFLDVKQIQINPFVEGYGVAVATSLPIAGHAGLHQQPLTLIVVVSCYLVRQRRARTHDAHPFCQDENSKRAQIARIGQRSSFASGTRNGHGIIRCKMKQEGRRHG